MRLALGTVEQRAACPGLLETLGALRAIPPTQLQEEAFMSQVGISLTSQAQWPGPCCTAGNTAQVRPVQLLHSELQRM